MKKHLGILWIVFAFAAGGCDTMKFNPFTPTGRPSPGSTTSEALSPPGAPTLITPPEGAVLDNGRTDYRDIIVWDFDWSDVEDADQYHIYVIGENAMYPVINCTVRTSSFHHERTGSYIADFNRLNWKWKVRAIGSGICGSWSEERTFDVEPVNTDPPR